MGLSFRKRPPFRELVRARLRQPDILVPLCPAPMPSTARPPETWSSEAIAAALTAGCRVSRLVTQSATRAARRASPSPPTPRGPWRFPARRQCRSWHSRSGRRARRASGKGRGYRARRRNQPASCTLELAPSSGPRQPAAMITPSMTANFPVLALFERPPDVRYTAASGGRAVMQRISLE